MVEICSALLPLAKNVLPQILKTAGFSALSGAVSGGIEKAIKGKGLFEIPQNKVDRLIKYKDYLTDSQKKQINQALQTGSGISRFRLTKKQQEGGFLGTLLASIGIPLLMNALTGKGHGRGLHVGPHLPTNTRNIYVPKTGRGKSKRQRSSSREKQSVQQYSNYRSNIVSCSAPRDKVVNIEKPLSSIDLNKLIKELNIKKFSGIFSRDNLPKRIRKEECGIINLDDFSGPGTHWVCWRNIDKNVCEYFDSFGLSIPFEVEKYLIKSGKTLFYSPDEIQERLSVLCGYWCLYYLIERRNGREIFEVLHNPEFSPNNQMVNYNFLKRYFNIK